MYHCFWIDPFGYHHKYLATDDLEQVVALVKKNAADPEDDTNVRGLRVVEGELLEFEPATVVETYRIASKS